MKTWLDRYKFFPRLGAFVFMCLTVHVVLVVMGLAQTGHELTDLAFAAVCGLVAVISGAAVKSFDYISKGEGGD